jgi:MSHA biogenesis protein MshN
MSLVNQMLKDLEQKRTEPQAASFLHQLKPVRVARLVRLHPALLLPLALLILACVFYVVKRRDTASALPPQPAVAHVSAELSKAPSPSPTSAPVEKVEAPIKQLASTSHSVTTAPVRLAEQASMRSIPTVKQRIALSLTEKADQAYANALAAIDAHDHDQAVMDLNRVLKLQPSRLDARQTLVTLLLTNDRLAEAEALVRQGIAQHPEHAPFENLIAHILARQGKYKEAIKMMNKANPKMAAKPDYYAYLAALYQHDGQYMMAAELYHDLVRMDDQNGVWWLGLGLALESAGKNNAALEAFNHALVSHSLTPSLQAYVQQEVDKLS